MPELGVVAEGGRFGGWRRLTPRALDGKSKVSVRELMSEDPSSFKTPEGEAKYIAAYDTTLTLWAIPYEFLEVPTQWGRTHLIVCGPKDGSPLVLLHGMHLSATMWFSNIAALSRKHRIYAVDTLGGVGRSVVVHPLESRADLAGWLDEVLDGLRITQPHIVGHSYGGWVALNFALSASERIKRLILLAPLHGKVSGIVGQSLERQIAEVNQRYTQLCNTRDRLQAGIEKEALTDQDIAQALSFRNDVFEGLHNITDQDKRKIFKLLRVQAAVRDQVVTITCRVPIGTESSEIDLKSSRLTPGTLRRACSWSRRLAGK